jgi:hypothetical protein
MAAPLREARVNDEVAVLRRREADREVVSIARVKFIGHVLIQTDDNRYYSVADGQSFGSKHHSFIEPATSSHRTALLERY